MESFEANLGRAGDAVSSLAEGPAREAADALEQAFSKAGQSIEASLSQAARAGELDFGKMARSILGDLAQIAAESALAKAGIGSAGQSFTLNFGGGRGAEKTLPVGTRAEVSKAIAKAAAIGGRYR